MAKVHSILQGGEFYYKLALEQISEDNYTDAIKNLLRATRLSSLDKYFIELAEAYYAIGAFDASNRVYFRRLAARPAMDYLLAISRNYIEMGEEGLAAEFAYKTLMSLGKKLSDKPVKRLINIGEDENMQRVFSGGTQEAAPILINLAERGESIALERAYELFHRGDYDGAIKHMLSIPKTSDNYIEAQEIISAAAIENGDKHLALKSAAEINAREPDNIMPLRVCLRYKAYWDGIYDEKKLVENFISITKNNRDDAMLRRLISVLYAQKNYLQAYNAAVAACDINGAHHANLFPLALVSFILGKNQEGERAMYKFAELYPENELAKLLLWRFSKKPSIEDWAKGSDFYYNDIISDYLNQAYIISPAKNIMTEKEQDLMDILLVGDDTEERAHLIYDALDSNKKGAREYMIKKLIDSGLDSDTRISILKMLIECGAEGVVQMLLHDQMVECELINPGRLPAYAQHFMISYSEAYAELLLSGYKISPKTLNKIIKELAATRSTSNKIHIIAAVIHYHYIQSFGEKISLLELAEIYGTTRQTIKKYLDIYKVNL